MDPELCNLHQQPVRFCRRPQLLSNGNPPNAPGGIVRFNPTDGSFNTYDVPFPYVRYLAMDTAEKHLLAFTDVDDNAHWVDLTTADPKTQAPPYYTLTLTNASGAAVALSRPVAAFFSADNSKAYVLSCGTDLRRLQPSQCHGNRCSPPLRRPLPLSSDFTGGYSRHGSQSVAAGQWRRRGIGLIDLTRQQTLRRRFHHHVHRH